MTQRLDAPCPDHRTPPAAGLFVSNRAPRLTGHNPSRDPACEWFESLFIAGTHCRPGRDAAKV